MYVVYMEVTCNIVGNDGKLAKCMLMRVRAGDSANHEGAKAIRQRCFAESHLETDRLRQMRDILWGMYPGQLHADFVIAFEK